MRVILVGEFAAARRKLWPRMMDAPAGRVASLFFDGILRRIEQTCESRCDFDLKIALGAIDKSQQDAGRRIRKWLGCGFPDNAIWARGAGLEWTLN